MSVDLRPDRHALLELEALLKEIATLRAEGNAARFNDDARYRWVLHRLWIAAGNEALAYTASIRQPVRAERTWANLYDLRNHLAPRAGAGSDREELYIDADGVSHAGQVAGIAGDDRGLVLDRGHDDDGIDHVRRAGRRAGHARRTADPLIIGKNGAALQDPRYLVLRPAAPGLGQHDNRHYRADPRPGHLIMQGQEIRIAALNC